MMLTVAHGHPRAPFLLWQLDTIAARSKDIRVCLLPILHWLIRNRLTGEKFVQWVDHDHQGSVLLMTAHVRMKISKDQEMKKIYGDDENGPLPMIRL